MGVYNVTKLFSNITIETTSQTNGYAASWIVPLAARVYVEKITCDGHYSKRGYGGNNDEEYARVIVNDRVLALTQCGGDRYGRRTLKKFLDSLTFAKYGGL
jgi:hypothetical protein